MQLCLTQHQVSITSTLGITQAWESESGNAERLPKSVCMKMVKVTEALNA
jgi:hypothetical protein